MHALVFSEFVSLLTLTALACTGCGHNPDHDDHADTGQSDGGAPSPGDSGKAPVGSGDDAGLGGDTHDASARDAGSNGDAGIDNGTHEDDGGRDAGPRTVALNFAALVGTEDFSCDKIFTGVGSTGASLEPGDFRLYVYDVRLLTRAGPVPVQLEDNNWQNDGVALLDFENASGTCQNGTSETNSTLRGTVPSGEYTGVAFRLGVPVSRNHINPAEAPSPLNLTSLHWNWNAGYKFARIDMRVLQLPSGDAGTAQATPYNFHLGSTMCTGDAATDAGVVCANVNSPEVELTDFDIATDTVTVDYAALVEGEDLRVDQGGKPGCMSFPGDADCAVLFSNLGLDYATGESKGTQSVFNKR